jgi:tetratricopeptide (TPR) repeat protein
LFSPGAFAADLEQGERLLRTGRYFDCARLAGAEIEKGEANARWHELKIQAELVRGKYAEAQESLADGLRRFPASIRLRLVGRDVHRYNGHSAAAAAELETIERLVSRSPRQYGAPADRLALGRFFLLRGTDARTVLELFYDVAIKQQPDLLEAYLATAELALDKQDFALAATTLRKAPKESTADPAYHYLLARALASDDHAASARALAGALKINAHHVDSLLLLVDSEVDAEHYAEAEKLLKQVFAVNPHEPRAWAYQAMLAHLRNDKNGEESARRSALSHWAENPEVDHLIGRKLSQKYRFAEGLAYQRKALEFDSNHPLAGIQLCQDLLRLGSEEEGWKLAGEIFAKDGYNVVAYNLVTLRESLSHFRALERDGFIVRMEKREADLYGERVLALLQRARKTLCEKYGVTLQQPVIVEIFPQKREFAVRTFGLPGAEGFLGVCFGRVITVNSPASQGEHPANWEAVLWHEFCHVVTLSKTRNRMPRWLSEGISVREERSEDAMWGARMNPQYRARILGSDLTPLSRLSGAFLGAKTPLDLQFAYYESSLGVDFLVQRFGMPVLLSILEDLGDGIPINDTLPRRTKRSLEELDRKFAQFARAQAEKLAPEVTWDEPDLPGDSDSATIGEWVAKHPKSFWGWKLLGARLAAEEKWPQAIEVLEKLKRLYPDYVGPGNAYMLLATVYRRCKNPAGEIEALEELADRDGDASPAYLRLMELDSAAGDWRALARNARRLLAVNPLLPSPHRQLARAAEELGERDVAVACYRALLLLDDPDPALVHYRLATLLHQAGKPAEARREVLKSLEEAPRYLEAHRLLLELIEAGGSGSPGSRLPAIRSNPEGKTP